MLYFSSIWVRHVLNSQSNFQGHSKLLVVYSYAAVHKTSTDIARREQCKSGWTVLDTVWTVNSSGPRNKCISWGVDPHTKRGNFEGERGLVQAQYMLRHVRRSTYSKLLSRGQNRYGTDGDWGVLNGGCTLSQHGEYDWTDSCATHKRQTNTGT